MKCPQCGLVNSQGASHCKRCGAAFSPEAPGATQGVNGGWRDSNLLVIASNTALPMRCLRCNSEVRVAPRRLRINHYSKSNLLTYFVGYLEWKEFTLRLPLCQAHNLSRWGSIVLGIALIFLGIAVVVAGFGVNQVILCYVGVAMVLAGFVTTAIKGHPISVHRSKTPFVWLRGINKNYLAPLPPWK
jgi:rubredoxin